MIYLARGRSLSLGFTPSFVCTIDLRENRSLVVGLNCFNYFPIYSFLFRVLAFVARFYRSQSLFHSMNFMLKFFNRVHYRQSTAKFS